ncbi:hypothetical protein BH23CHL7_BH23CHL7_20020 [soil metagenome]
MPETLGIGIVGAGRFAEFCIGAFDVLSGARVVAVMDVDLQRARAVAPPRAAVYAELGAMLDDPAVDIVHVGTPPASHGPIALRAIEARRHVFVEKPLAIRLHEAQAVVAAAEASGVVVSVDYVLRHHPLHKLALAVTRSGALGPLRHFALVNLASVKSVPVGHWFWDRAVSGGIHVEHGVHFLDLSLAHAGCEADSVSGVQQRRADGAVDRESALVRFGDEMVATFVHGFIRTAATERTTIGLYYELGQVTMNGWIPTDLQLDAVVDEAWAVAALRDLFDGAAFDVAPFDEGGRRRQRVLAAAEAPDREAAYRAAIVAGMADLVDAAREGRQPLVTARDAVRSLELALRAQAGAPAAGGRRKRRR